MSQNNYKPKIFIAGHNGMVGSAIIKYLISQGFDNIITRSHKELDLTNQSAVEDFFSNEKPNQVYLAAAKVGGIHANNTYPAEFIYQNIMISSNVIESCFRNNVKKLLYLGSSCIYPKEVVQPMTEEALLTGTLEPTNEPYAIAKIVGLKTCESYNRQFGKSHGIDYRSIMPTNIYGPGDNYHFEDSHVIPSLIRRFHEAKESNSSYVTIWGTGTPRREFLYVDDLASACVLVMNIDKKSYEKHTKPMNSHINVGSGNEITINDLAYAVANVIGFRGEIKFDPSKPNGSPRKLIESSRILSLGWKPNVSLKEGLKKTYIDFCKS